MRNQIEWHLAMKLIESNKERTTIWVRAEPMMVYELRDEFKLLLSTPNIREQLATYRKRILRIFLNMYAQMKSLVLIRFLKCIQVISVELQEGDPFE